MTKYALHLLLLVILFSSCEKRSETLDAPAISEYYPMEVGKYITYDLDSTLFTNFGQTIAIQHYQAQDRVEEAITDNSGRPSYRIVRYLRENNNQAWLPTESFLVTPTTHSVEFVENNMRFIKLKSPIVNDFSWKGNSYIDTYNTSGDWRYLDNWDYIYDSVGAPFSSNGGIIAETITVQQRDEILGQDPSLPGTQYAEKNYSVEKYGKNIGLVFREFMHWEYQGGQNGSPGYYNGFGVKMTIRDHN